MARIVFCFLFVALFICLCMILFNFNFSFKEITVNDIQIAFKQNRLSSRQLVEYYLGQIQRANPVLKGIIEVNPDALSLADKADQERKRRCQNHYPAEADVAHELRVQLNS